MPGQFDLALEEERKSRFDWMRGVKPVHAMVCISARDEH
jgi:hypothetical protein